jgi:hypothetical protein
LDGIVFPLGQIIGSFEVKECLNVLYKTNTEVLIGSRCQKISGNELKFGDYTMKRSVWIGQNHRVLKNPIPYKGQQGYYTKFKGDINQLKFL